MKRSYFSVLIIFILQRAEAQKGSAELMAGHHYLHYQHSITQVFSPLSKWGWQHMATLAKRYQPIKEKTGYTDELMNQAYLSYGLSQWLTIRGGLFYTNAGGYKPSLGMQFLLAHKHGVFLIAPRADLVRKGSYELFLFGEYFIPAVATTRFVARVQAMSNVGATHNRSYQLIRLGIDRNQLQLGGGLTLDEYGTTNIVYLNAGIFIRKKW